MAAVAAILVGMVAPHEVGITPADRMAVGVLAKTEHR